MITLAEALPLRKTIEKRMGELKNERNENSTVTLKQGEDIMSYISKTPDQLTQELNELREDYIALNNLITRANLDNTIETEKGTKNLIDAIELAKIVREESNWFKRFATTKKLERDAYNKNSDLVTVATFDPDFYRVEALKLERFANKLSALVEQKNHTIELDFDASKYIG
jgi:hypothetical protein